MKIIILIISALFLVTNSFAQIISFPDINFKTKLLSAEAGNGIAYLCNGNSFKLDVNNDGEIQVSEALMVCSLAISNSIISDLTGLEYFTNLEHLQCNNNSITELDLSALTNIVGFDINNNQLMSVNISGLSEVHNISFRDNQLTSINVLGLSNLAVLDIRNNQITSLSLDEAPELQYLYCQNNDLSSIDVNNLENLIYLDCSFNDLTTLNIKNESVENLNFSNNENLQYICADAEQLTYVEDLINQYGLTNCFTNSLCSFNSGGDTFKIFGNVKYDENQDGCDPSDMDYPELRLTVSDGVNSGDVLADISGNYHYTVQAGNYSIVPQVQNPSFFTVSPSTATVNFPSQTSPHQQDFCIEPNGEHPDLEIMLLALDWTAYPGEETSYRITFNNKGNLTQSGSVQLSFDDEVSNFVSSTPPISSSSQNLLEWDFSDLQPFESREIEFTLYIHGPSDIPPLDEGDILYYTANLITSEIDETPADNTVSIEQFVSFIVILKSSEFEFSDYFTLYPNPGEDFLNIKILLGIEIETIEIYDTIGQLVSKMNDQFTSPIDVSSWSSGNYFIIIQTNKGVFNSTFIRK